MAKDNEDYKNELMSHYLQKNHLIFNKQYFLLQKELQ